MSPKHTIYCLGEVLLALDADAPLAHAESFRPRLGGDAAVLAQACAAQGGRASLLAQLGEDPFGHRAASTLAVAGVDTTHASFSRTLPTALLFEAGGEACSYRVRTAGLQFAPEQLEPGLFQPGDALLFASSGLCDSPLRYTHLAALTAARDAGALTCFVPCLEPALWPQPEGEAAPREVTRQLLPGQTLSFSPRKSWNFCSARRRCGWRFSLSCGGTPSWCFWPAPRASTPLPARTMHSGRGSPSLPRGWPPRRSVVCCKKTVRRKNCPASPPGSCKRSYKKRTKPPPVSGGFASQGFQLGEDCGLFG